ncbi:MAG: aspartate carbamoyltransferase regulatory subunit [Succinivibrio sp.]
MSENNTENKSKLLVEAIANGTVIDHIAPGQAINIIRMFKFLSRNNQLTVGFNLRSGELGKKDIIKISDMEFSPAQTEQIAILAPNATINHIKDFKVVDKYKLRLPHETVGVFKCPNSNCITNDTEDASTKFKIGTEGDKVIMKCRYCERVFDREVVLQYNGLES